MAAAHARAHRTPALLLACLLVLATGVALLGLARAFPAPLRSEAPPVPAATVAVVGAFYAAANTVLRTGDAAALDAILAPGFVDHHPAVGVAPGRDGLAQALVARHATFPGLRLVVDHVEGGDRVTVHVHAEGETDGVFLGLPLPESAGTWGPVEVFRVEGDVIAERWGAGASPLDARPLWEVPCPQVRGDTPRSVVFLERRAYGPGEAQLLGADAAARLVFVESGTLTAVGEAVTGDRAVPLPGVLAGAGAVTELREPVALATGDLVAIPPTGRLATRNDGTAPTAVVIVTIAAADRLPAGTAAKARASAEVVLSPGATLAAGRLVLAPGAGLVWSNPPGPLLVLVEAGRVEVATRDDTGPAATWRTLATGDGWATRAGRDGFWQAAPGGSAVLFVVTVATAVSGGAADPPPNADSAPT